jgi:hypothetical protein
MKNILNKKWKYLLAICAGLAILAGIYAYRHYYVPAITPVSDTLSSSIAGAQLQNGHFISLDDAKEVSNLIQQRIQSPPDVIYYTSTQQEADNKAQEIAKKDGRETNNNGNTVNNSGAKTNTENSSLSTGGQIINNYYAITQEKKNKLSAGITL